MNHELELDLTEKYNEGLTKLPATTTPPVLEAPTFHPSTEQVTQARKNLPIVILVLGLFLLFAFGIAWLVFTWL